MSLRRDENSSGSCWPLVRVWRTSGSGKHKITIDQNLPLDVQFCIAAAMTIPMTRHALDETTARLAM
ncbi:MAG TPA: hypothetical protein PLY87_01240 [Planctomycetaceae bacterium]|nr:hypothetical protein [Planctomycetaceae bacterium]HQZ63661.1 hypothetical protein [Planctomycetaceae bacterium]